MRHERVCASAATPAAASTDLPATSGDGARGAAILTIGLLTTGGEEASAIAEPLQSAGYVVRAITIDGFLAAPLDSEHAAAIVTDAALEHVDLAALAGILAAQPVWSDFPIILLADRATPLDPAILALPANLWLVERQPDSAALLIAARSAVRARERQRLVGGALDCRGHAEERSRELREELAERAAELEVTNDLLRAEVDDRSRAEARLRSIAERFRLVFRATNDAIRDWSVPEDRMRWNQAATALFGLAPGGTRLADWSARIHPQDRERAATAFCMFLAGKEERWTGEYRFLTADGRHADIVDRSFVIRDPAGKPLRVVGAMSDVTERRGHEARLRQAQSELIHGSRLSAMAAMASTLAHELNQPLATVSNYVRGCRKLLELRSEDDPGGLRAALATTEASALRAGEIVRQLRDMVAADKLLRRPEALPALIEDACLVGVLEAPAGDIDLSFAFGGFGGAVMVDRVQIQQVLINLVRNGIEATEDSTDRRIMISTHRVGAALAEVRVTDSGPGLPARPRGDLFTPFNSTKPGSIGVGLSICRTIVEAHGGTISAATAACGGAAFAFTLPIAEAETGAPTA